MSVLRFNPTCSLDPLLLLCRISLRVMEVRAKVTGQARAQLDAVVEAKRGAKAAAPLLQIRAGSDRPPRQEWVARFGKRTFCVLWNQGKCDLENCQYKHLCCVAANGKPQALLG